MMKLIRFPPGRPPRLNSFSRSKLSDCLQLPHPSVENQGNVPTWKETEDERSAGGEEEERVFNPKEKKKKRIKQLLKKRRL